MDVAWSPHDAWLASCSVDNTVVIWNALKFPGKWERFPFPEDNNGVLNGSFRWQTNASSVQICLHMRVSLPWSCVQAVHRSGCACSASTDSIAPQSLTYKQEWVHRCEPIASVFGSVHQVLSACHTLRCDCVRIHFYGLPAHSSKVDAQASASDSAWRAVLICHLNEP